MKIEHVSMNADMHSVHVIPHKVFALFAIVSALCVWVSKCLRYYQKFLNGEEYLKCLEIEFSNENSIFLKIFIDVSHHLSSYFIGTWREYGEPCLSSMFRGYRISFRLQEIC